MRQVARSSLLAFALVAGAALTATGCENGGLLVVQQKPPPEGPSVNEFVSGGTYASNQKYRLFYTNGQATPNQGPLKNESNRLNGGIVGAAHSD
ncbi:MAG: hypothetical protein R3B70_34070 [Polyangiaceae bacterium]